MLAEPYPLTWPRPPADAPSLRSSGASRNLSALSSVAPHDWPLASAPWLFLGHAGLSSKRPALLASEPLQMLFPFFPSPFSRPNCHTPGSRGGVTSSSKILDPCPQPHQTLVLLEPCHHSSHGPAHEDRSVSFLAAWLGTWLVPARTRRQQILGGATEC